MLRWATCHGCMHALCKHNAGQHRRGGIIWHGDFSVCETLHLEFTWNLPCSVTCLLGFQDKCPSSRIGTFWRICHFFHAVLMMVKSPLGECIHIHQQVIIQKWGFKWLGTSVDTRMPGNYFTVGGTHIMRCDFLGDWLCAPSSTFYDTIKCFACSLDPDPMDPFRSWVLPYFFWGGLQCSNNKQTIDNFETTLGYFTQNCAVVHATGISGESMQRGPNSGGTISWMIC